MTRDAERAAFLASFVLCAGSLLALLLVIGLPAEGDPRAWLIAVPFAAPILVALALRAAGRRGLTVVIVEGGLLGAIGMLLLLFGFAALTLSS